MLNAARLRPSPRKYEQRRFEASLPSFLLRRYCAGTGNWSRRNGRFWNVGNLADRVRRLTLNISSCGLTIEKPDWGYTRILGALRNLELKIGRSTIQRILKDHLIKPAPARGHRIPWSVFLKAHWKAIAASDFFTVEVWNWRGLITHYVLFVIDLDTRRVVIGGITTNPNEAWMLQVARGLTDGVNGALLGKRHLIVDRDTKYSTAFRTFIAREGIEVIRLPPRSPNLNAYAERFVRSVKSECLSKLIPIGAPMLRRALHEYMEHYHHERNHQGLGNKLIAPVLIRQSQSERIDRRSRLGGLLNFYERAAA